MNETQITLNFTETTVVAVNFLVTHDDLKILAIGYFRERLSYEYESWAMGASGFAPTTQEWFDYHFAGERLDAIRQIISPKQMQKAKELAESLWLHDNKIDSNVWKEFLGVATPATPSHATIMKNLNESERLRHLPKTEEERKRDFERL